MKVIHISPSLNEVLVFNCSKQMKQTLDYRGAQIVFQPAFKIGEVAQMLDRKADTIRKWEYREIIPPQPQVQVSPKKWERFYSQKDIEAMRDMVGSIHVGRPRKDRRITNTIPAKGQLKSYLRERIKAHE